MKEIGGYFGLQRFHGHEYHENALRFNFARYAITYAATVKRVRTVYVPTFLCDSVAKALCSAGFKIQTYPISKDWLPILKKPLVREEAIVVVNYFGQLDNEMIEKLRTYHRNLIIDNVQSFFQKPVEGVSTVYSCRKYFGVSDGAYLYLDATETEYKNLPQDCSGERLFFLAGRYEQGAQAFYPAFQKNEEGINQAGPRRMSTLTQNLLRAVDYKECIFKRKRNTEYLSTELQRYNLLQVKNHAGLFMYPFLQRDIPNLREKLIEEKVFIPKLWPILSKSVSPDSNEADFAENIIWLPIDQRYEIEDMDDIVIKIKRNCGWIF